MIFLVIYLISWVSITGLAFGYVQGYFYMVAAEEWREDLGWALLCGMLGGLLGPLGVFIAWCMTGLGKYGWRVWPAKE